MRRFFSPVLLAASLVSVPALAFERTQGCNNDGSVCSLLAWPTNCATYLLDAASEARSGIPIADLEREIDISFAAWDASEVACSFLTLTSDGLAPNLAVGFDGDGEEENIIVFIDEGWTDLPGVHDPSAIALTSVFFDPESGTIVNADMEFNADFFEPIIDGETFGIDPQRPDADIRNTITHEAGHFLGLDHSADGDATMFFAAAAGETIKQTLAQDDVNGLCAIYPVADDPEECEPAGFIPRKGLFGRCSVAEEEARPAGRAGLGLLVFGLFALALFSRRRTRAA